MASLRSAQNRTLSSDPHKHVHTAHCSRLPIKLTAQAQTAHHRHHEFWAGQAAFHGMAALFPPHIHYRRIMRPDWPSRLPAGRARHVLPPPGTALTYDTATWLSSRQMTLSGSYNERMTPGAVIARADDASTSHRPVDR